ncbi:SIR2 family protein [Psychrobacillus sp. FSL K6-1415]|uniref:SIR2 family protein n=1 Tax=Psychrobacillus sp. FSL K6-1415 TaxID=2921544 RepID=UPI0030F8F8AA
MIGLMEFNEAHDQYQQHLSLIKEAIEKKEAYLFIGAGFSQNAEPKTKNIENQYKTWNGFMYQLAEKLWPTGSPEKLKEKISGDHLMIAQLFEEEFGKATFYEELIKAVPYKDYLPSTIHKEVITLNGKGSWAGIMTTNQDCLIEATLNEQHINHDVIISDFDISTKSASTKVFKLHGTMERPESIIFSEEQYRTYESDHPLLHVKLKSVFAENVTVFIGFSLTDPNFKSIYGWVRDILQTNYQRKAYAFIFDSDIDEYTRRYWEKRNIIIIPIPTNGFHDKGRAFVNGMRHYIETLTETPKITQNNDVQMSVSDIEQSLYNLIKEEEWTSKKTITLVTLLSELKKKELLRNFEFQPFFKKVYPHLKQQDKLKILLALYPLVYPFLDINGEPIINEVIQILKEDQNLQDFDLLYQILADKAESLFAFGKYEELKTYVDETLVEYSDLNVKYRNELLYWLIASEKLNLNFEGIRLYLNRISVDWNDPLWLNRMASVHYFVGDHSVALNYINRAIQAAEQKKDDWNLYLSCLSKRSLFGPDIFRDDYFYTEADHIQNVDLIRNLNAKLKDTNNPTYQKWQELGDLKSKWWSEYMNWKESLGPHRNGFHSMKSSSLNMIEHLVWFHEANGIPFTALMEKKYDVIPDILLENHQLVKAAIYGILLGFDKKISTLLHFESLNNISLESRLILYQQTISFAEHLLVYMNETKQNIRHELLGSWLNALLQCWERIIPILYDDEIRGIYEKIWDFQSFYRQKPVHFDHFANIYERLISVFSVCIYFIKEDSAFSRLKEWSLSKINSPRKFTLLSDIYWEDLKENLQTDSDFINKLLQINNKNADELVVHWLENDIFTEVQKELVHNYIFVQENENEKRKQLFSSFFADKLEYPTIEKRVLEEINQFIQHNSSSDVNQLHVLSKLVKEMNEEHIKTILEYSEKKISFSKREQGEFMSVFTIEEITSAYLSFIIQLVIHGKATNEQLLSKLEEFPYWSERFNQGLLKLNKIKGLDQDRITKLILQGLQVFDPNHRGTFCVLSGFWLKQEGDLTLNENDIVEILLQSARDTNINVASKAINGLARTFQGKGKSFSLQMIGHILKVTDNTLTRRHISLLTNLAFLYNELNKLENLEDHQSLKIQETRASLSELPYANVRKELLI